MAVILKDAGHGTIHDELLDREVDLTRQYCILAEVDYPSQETIKRGLKAAQKTWGSISVHDRFVPAGIGLPEAFRFFCNFDKQQEAAGQPTLKLYDDVRKEWWCQDKDIEHLATQAGIIRCDFHTVWLPTDIQGRPFDLGHDDQVAWAKEQGGDGLTSAEETLYLFARCLLELQRPLWGAGLVRCRNRYGSDGSLHVDWDADDGLFVGYWNRDDAHWALAALPRKFMALGD